MKNKKKYDLLGEVKNFPKVKTSGNFTSELHGRLDNIISEEKTELPSPLKKENIHDKKNKFFEFLSGLFSNKFFVPAFGMTVLLIFAIYFFTKDNDTQLTTENDQINKVPTENKNENEFKLPVIKDPFTKSETDTNDLITIPDPKEELNKLITKGKNTAEESKDFLTALLKEKETDLKLFNPDLAIKNFGNFNPAFNFSHINTAVLKSETLDIKKLEGIQKKIENISK
ncbi:MAG: hypothetical protein IPM38_13825 [Ignavibacteria bacterium]|nr:hypothetical protein [Ignavibacteria bacterium]